MNTIKQFLLFFALGAVLLVTSCGTEDEPIITPDPPTISVADANGFTSSTVDAGASVTLAATAFGNAAIASAKIYVDQTEVKNYNPSGIEQFGYPPYTYTTTADQKGKIMTITYTATDINGKQGEASYTLTVSADTPMAYESTGSILGNLIGPDQSAWNLVTNVREAKSATSDMQNPSLATGTLEEQWIKGWNAETTTQYVKSNAFNYDNATVEAAVASYAEGTPTSSVRNVVVGDIFIAKLRGKDAYAVIKMTRVDNRITTGSHVEEMHFSYKKLAANTGE